MIPMNKNRLSTLTDSVFAIIMTLLVLEIKVPEFAYSPNNNELASAIIQLLPDILSFFISFVLLGTYWMAHHFIFNNYVKKVDRVLSYMNMVFLLMASFIPFSSSLLGKYNDSDFAITFYGFNIIMIGLSLYFLRDYLLSKKNLRCDDIDHRDVIHGTIRIFLPPTFALMAIFIANFSLSISYILFIIPFVFNIIPGGLKYIESVLFNNVSTKQKNKKIV